MAGYFQQGVNVTVTGSGGTGSAATATINLPHRAGILMEASVDLTTGSCTKFGFDLWETSTRADNDQIITVGSTTMTEYNSRNYQDFFVGQTAISTSDSASGEGYRSAVTVRVIPYAGGPNGSTHVFAVKIGGLGIS